MAFDFTVNNTGGNSGGGGDPDPPASFTKPTATQHPAYQDDSDVGLTFTLDKMHRPRIDAQGETIFEPWEGSKTFYITGAPAGWTEAEIEAQESITISGFTAWLHSTANTEGGRYGLSSAKPLLYDSGSGSFIDDAISSRTDTHIFFERGYTYSGQHSQPTAPTGQDPLKPVWIGAFGTGTRPLVNMEPSAGIEPLYAYATLSQLSATRHLNFVAFSGTPRPMMLMEGIVFDGDNDPIDDHMSVGSGTGDCNYFTMRHCLFYDNRKKEPSNGSSYAGATAANADRYSGIYITKTEFVLFEENYFDHNGWGENFNPDGSWDGVSDDQQPPSKYSHNIYDGDSNKNQMFRRNMFCRPASTNIQGRSGGTYYENFFWKAPFHVFLAGDPNRDFFCDSVILQAVNWGATDFQSNSSAGASGWGIDLSAADAVLLNSTVAHAIGTDLGSQSLRGTGTTHFSNLTVYNWDGEYAGLAITTERDNKTPQDWWNSYQSTTGSTDADIANGLRAMAQPWDALDNLFDFLGTSFVNVPILTGRVSVQTVVWEPWNGADGFNWSNRFNFSTIDHPGTVSGDSFDLNGGTVHFMETVENLNTVDLGGGTFNINSGSLAPTAAVAGGGTFNIHNAGQLWLPGYSSTALTINLGGDSSADFGVTDAGRVANTGTVTSNVSIVAENHAQVIFAYGAAEFRISTGETVRLVGDGVWAGFDGASGTAQLTVQSGGTLRFEAGASGFSTIRERKTGYDGIDTDPGVTSTVVLASGAVIEVDSTGLGSGTYDLIDVDSLTDSGATLPAGVAVSGNKLQLTVA